jgi:hypothetical protein
MGLGGWLTFHGPHPNSPRTDAASELARPAIDLAVGERLPESVSDDLGPLADAMIRPAVACPDARTVGLNVWCELPSVRLEVRWTSAGSSTDGLAVRGRGGGTWARINRLSDRWGISHHGRHYCVWAERFADADPGTWPQPPRVPAA